MNKIALVTCLLFCAVFFTACDKDKEDEIEEEKEIPALKQNIDGARIAWDFSTRVRISPAEGKPPGYYGYARMIELHDGRLACVYEATPGNTEIVFSTDNGSSWSLPQIVFQTQNNTTMAVPNIIELSDQSILVACNPRPREPYTEDRLFGIKVIKSTDGGSSWSAEQTVYEAKSTFEDGCWEPAFVQLPSGEVQLFFANESMYTSSNEQNISMLRSDDFGESWTDEPVIAGFRQGRRDGMPVPLLLPDEGELLVAIEDNKIGEFKPAIYHEKIVDNWNDGTISGTDSRRAYQPLSVAFSDNIYAGAPYLARLETGEVLLSYQANWNRDSRWDLSAMMVEIGDNSGSLFSKRTIPFDIPITKSGLWNSLAVISGNTPVAITSTNAYSASSTEVWMVKGYVIPEYEIKTGTATVDGELNDNSWQGDWPYFIGYKSARNLSASLCVDESFLYVGVEVNNLPAGFEAGSKVTFLLDTERKGYEKPHEGIYSFECGFNGQVIIKQGSYGEWADENVPDEVLCQVKNMDNASQLELAIPLQSLGSNLVNSIGVNFVLSYQAQGSTINESITNSEISGPYTWCPATIK